MATHMLLSLCLTSVLGHLRLDTSMSGQKGLDISLKYGKLNFATLAQTFKGLAEKGVDVTTAEKEFHLPQDEACDGPCAIILAQVGNKSAPEVLFSGAVHGDERLGPVVAAEVAALLAESDHPDLRWLRAHRSFLLVPAANSVGYYQSERSEHGVDVNRDFPNDQEKPSQCLRSRAARTFYSLFAKHHIQVALTMHAGAQQLCYPWGDFAHQRAERSNESPDYKAFEAVGQAMQQAGGHQAAGIRGPGATRPQDPEWFWTLGHNSELQYPKHGSMEDWMYGGAWSATRTECAGQPGRFGEFKSPRAGGGGEEPVVPMRALSFLLESTDNKDPPVADYGSRGEVFASEPQGLVPRTVRLFLRLAEFAEPAVLFAQGAFLSTAADAGGAGPTSAASAAAAAASGNPGVRVRPVGCVTANLRVESTVTCAAAEAVLQSEELNVKCPGLSLWGEPDIPVTVDSRAGCVRVTARFDDDWQVKPPDDLAGPEANREPQSFVVTGRKNSAVFTYALST